VRGDTTATDGPAVAGPAPLGRRAPGGDLDRFVARLLTLGTYVSVALLATGVVLMLAAGVSPVQSDYPAFRPTGILDDVRALRPEGFLWLGLVAVVLTPASRVLASLVGYVREDDQRMAVIAVGILAVIATSVVSAIVTGA
jgi:uncharacterized membrane protein